MVDLNKALTDLHESVPEGSGKRLTTTICTGRVLSGKEAKVWMRLYGFLYLRQV